MIPEIRNLFDSCSSSEAEHVHSLLEGNNLKIERIVSNGHASPEGFWYDQESAEWVILLEGNAVLEFENGELRKMQKGDYLLISHRLKHRVQQVSVDAVWLALHFKGGLNADPLKNGRAGGI